MSYRYTRRTYREGKLVHEETKEMTSEELYQLTSHVGELAFLRLINRWNHNGAANIHQLYIYTATMS